MVTFVVIPISLIWSKKSLKHYKGFSGFLKFLKIDKMIHLVIGSKLLHLDNEELFLFVVIPFW